MGKLYGKLTGLRRITTDFPKWRNRRGSDREMGKTNDSINSCAWFSLLPRLHVDLRAGYLGPSWLKRVISVISQSFLP